jgi:hypothetical protein
MIRRSSLSTDLVVKTIKDLGQTQRRLIVDRFMLVHYWYYLLSV